MPLRRGPEQELGFSFAEVGTPEELKRAEEASAELVEQTLAAAERIARERDVQLAELLHRTGEQLDERVIELLREEPVWKLSRSERRALRSRLEDES